MDCEADCKANCEAIARARFKGLAATIAALEATSLAGSLRLLGVLRPATWPATVTTDTLDAMSGWDRSGTVRSVKRSCYGLEYKGCSSHPTNTKCTFPTR